MKNKSKKIGILLIAGLLLVSMLGWAINEKLKPVLPKPVHKVEMPAPKVYDPVLLGKMQSMLRTLDFNRQSFCYAGSFDDYPGHQNLCSG